MSPKRRNRISGQWSGRLIEKFESPAYRVLSRTAHMVISRIEIELGHHGGNDNGKLPVTTDDFVEYGMHRTSVAPGIREAEALGFIKVTERGRGGNREYRTPSLFFLTFAHGRDSKAIPRSHDWRRIQTLQEAERTSRDARANKNPSAVEHGKRSWRKRREKQNTGTENSSGSVRDAHTESPRTPILNSKTTVLGEKADPLSVARMGTRSGGRLDLDHLGGCDG
jgi:hypothetical protein